MNEKGFGADWMLKQGLVKRWTPGHVHEGDRSRTTGDRRLEDAIQRFFMTKTKHEI